MAEDKERIDQLAADILNFSRNTLVVNLRFMDRAISMLQFVRTEGMDGVAVDGAHIFYDPLYVLRAFHQEKTRMARQYLHMILHCVFHHYWIGTLVDRAYWDLACDIAVECVVYDLGISAVAVQKEESERIEIENIKRKVKYMTADFIYRHFLEERLSEEETRRLSGIFAADLHDPWYARAAGDGRAAEKISEDWKSTAKQMQMDLSTFKKKIGDRAGSMTQNLSAVTREKYNYSKFLKQFAVFGERMKLNMDEFDYIFYTYGLQSYGNMPLIEPLEYKEVRQIKEFVIAIDTSGSTSGDLVQRFVQKTYHILKGEESFWARFNLHIVQCDAEIQEAVKITNQAEFDAYLASMKIKGLGGTDFRPVFQYVDQLVERREFQNLKGMIYFTDGYGTFPQKQPSYQVAVVYVTDGYDNPDVPAWAIKLVLQPEDIRGMEHEH